MYIGIISYFPPDEPDRSARKKAHRQQLSWLRGLFGKDQAIHVVAQNYDEGDYAENIIYTSFEHGIGPAKARNVILRDFYKTSEPFLLMLDDDCMLYDYYDGWKLLLEMRDNPEKFKGLGCVAASNPRYLPFKGENFKDKRVLTHWKFTKRPYNTRAPLAVYSNVKDMFFDKENNPIEKRISEDVDFHIRWIQRGYKAFICPQWQVKDMSYSTSTCFTKENRIEEEKLCVRNMLKKAGLDIVKDGKIKWTSLDSANRTDKVGYIRRAETYSFKENEIPKQRGEDA